MAAKKAEPKSRKPAVKKTAAKHTRAKKAAPTKAAPRATSVPKAKSRKPAPKRSARKQLAAAPKRIAPQLSVPRAEAPDKKAMLERALTGTPRPEERVAEKRLTWAEVHARSLADPNGFWGAAAGDIDWDMKWDKVLDDSNPPFYRWFTGGLLNTCYNALDRHIKNGRGDRLALIHDSPVTDTVRRFTFRQLRDDVARFAGVLAALGVVKGDRVIIYMPMVPEAVIAMLACARIGAIHSVVFGGFASHELAKRIDDAAPKMILSEIGRAHV